MLVYAGIDEAGYGPLLGPLCVGCSVFIVQGHDPSSEKGAPNLWRTLNKIVCRKSRDSRRRIAVEDSKKLKGANSSVTVHPLTHLERGVLAFCACNGESGLPVTDNEFFARIRALLPTSSWYASQTALPVAHTADQLRIAANRLRRGLDAAGVACAGIACEVVHADEFNRQVARMNNKASVNMAAALRLVDRIWRRFSAAGPEHPRVILDRHGGRTHYREELQLAWPEAHIQILAEDEAICRYRLTRAAIGDEQAMLTVTFMPEAEAKHLPVALASMTAKYVRELFMLRLNRFFAQHLPELKPTAGYYGDAQRYIEAIEPVMKRLNVSRAELVRSV